jgi:hypothetical protein
VRKKKRYSMKLESVGNPDFGQYAPVSPSRTVHGDTLFEMRDHVREYIREWNLGGGNWPWCSVREGRKIVGCFSYGARLFKCEKFPDFDEDLPEEIVIKDKPKAKRRLTR